MSSNFPSTHSLRVLASVHFGLAPDAWAKSRAERAGYTAVKAACIRRGALTADLQLTDYGRHLIHRHARNPTV